MASISSVIGFLDALLNPGAFEDHGPNGLQVPGSDETGVVVTGVTANVALFEHAAEQDARLALVHHGLFWGRTERIDTLLHRRLAPLFAHRIALAAYHLPLDAHLEVGNNALLAQAIEAEVEGPAFHHRGTPVGVVARFGGDGIPAGEFVDRVRGATHRDPLCFLCGPERVRRVGIVTGGGSDFLPGAIDAGVDAFITGEPAERVMSQAREGRVHFLAAGHYATETFGIRRLGDLLEERFGLRHVFFDDPNPV